MWIGCATARDEGNGTQAQAQARTSRWSWDGRFASICVSLEAYFCLSHDLPGALPSVVDMHTIWQHNLEISGRPSVQHEKIKTKVLGLFPPPTIERP